MTNKTWRRIGNALAAGTLAAMSLGESNFAHAATLIQVFAQAQRNNPELRSAQANYQAALARVPLAKSALLPQISAGASVSENAQNNSENPLLQKFGFPTTWHYVARDIDLSATQALYRPEERVDVTQAEIRAQIAYLQLVQANQALMMRLANGYFAVLAAQDTVQSLLAEKNAIQQQLSSARHNFAAGNGTIVDVRDAQSRNALTAAKLIAAQNTVEVARAALEQMIGVPPAALATLTPGVRLPSAHLDAAVLVNAAEHDNLAVREAMLEVHLAEMEVRKADSSGLPTVDAFARLDHASTSGGSNLFPFGNRADVASIGVQVRVPLFTGYRIQSNVQETAHLLDKSRSDLDQARRTAAQDARTAYLNLQSSLAQVRALKAAIDASQTSVHANETGYNAGLRVNIDVLNALAQLYATERDADKASYDVLTNELRLKLATGTLRARDLSAISALLQP